MEKKLSVKPLGLFACLADALMVPIMYALSGTTESPQRTHRWNNIKLRREDVQDLNFDYMVHCKGISGAMSRFNPFFHLPIFGGWRDYVVLQPKASIKAWHVGWIANDSIGVSRITLCGPVRLLLGPGDVSFFGVCDNNNLQIALEKVGEGRIGCGGPYSRVPLL